MEISFDRIMRATVFAIGVLLFVCVAVGILRRESFLGLLGGVILAIAYMRLAFSKRPPAESQPVVCAVEGAPVAPTQGVSTIAIKTSPGLKKCGCKNGSVDRAGGSPSACPVCSPRLGSAS